MIFLSSFVTAFIDDFNRVDNDHLGNGWNESGSGININNSQLYISGSAASYANHSAVLSSSFSFTISPNSINKGFYAWLYEENLEAIQIRFHTDGTIDIWDGAAEQNIMNYNTATDYKFYITVDYGADTFDVSINGDDKGTFGFRNGGIDTVDEIKFYAADTGLSFFVDDVATDSVPSFNLTLVNYYNGSSINNFTANITNTTGEYQIGTTNGTIVWELSQIVNITIWNITWNRALEALAIIIPKRCCAG